MTRERRQWSKEEKLRIIQEVEVNGLQPTLRKYNLSQSLFHKWKRRFNEQGISGLEAQYPKVDPEKRRMEQEIKRLRELVGELSLELRFKDELLKKTGFLKQDAMQVIEFLCYGYKPVTDELFDKFESFHHADMKIARYIFTYNHIRKHGSLGLRTPVAVWNEYFSGQTSDKQSIAVKPEVRLNLII